MIATVEGRADVKRRLLAMSAVASQRTLQTIIEPRARTIRDMIAAQAPVGKAPADKHPGQLRRGVVLNYLRGGVGYSKWLITLTKLAYYGVFQEFGLGGKVSARTQKRYAQYDYSKGVQKGLKQRGVTLEQINAAYYARPRAGGFGLNRRELRRQRTLAQGRRLQGGGRRRNMAAHPFFRPVITFTRQWFVQAVFTDIWNAIAAQGAGGGKQ